MRLTFFIESCSGVHTMSTKLNLGFEERLADVGDGTELSTFSAEYLG